MEGRLAQDQRQESKNVSPALAEVRNTRNQSFLIVDDEDVASKESQQTGEIKDVNHDDIAIQGKFTRLVNSEVLWVAQYMSFHQAESHCKTWNSGLIELWSEIEWAEVADAFKGAPSGWGPSR